MTLPARTLHSLNQEKALLLKNPQASAYDFVRLAEEYALLDASRQVDICMMYADGLMVDSDPDTLEPDDFAESELSNDEMGEEVE